ncbi:hypothetical protein CLF_108268 [Clonorchis sinensis]|uniref:Uncharacterized protein n=1 Tax=Clonorchis sinensis TaxID=79923 RepID=G7YRG2_CLOSI|nr:hypothetical protein CLF_108268 [Clonorchis sinensis]
MVQHNRATVPAGRTDQHARILSLVHATSLHHYACFSIKRPSKISVDILFSLVDLTDVTDVREFRPRTTMNCTNTNKLMPHRPSRGAISRAALPAAYSRAEFHMDTARIYALLRPRSLSRTSTGRLPVRHQAEFRLVESLDPRVNYDPVLVEYRLPMAHPEGVRISRSTQRCPQTNSLSKRSLEDLLERYAPIFADELGRHTKAFSPVPNKFSAQAVRSTRTPVAIREYARRIEKVANIIIDGIKSLFNTEVSLPYVVVHSHRRPMSSHCIVLDEFLHKSYGTSRVCARQEILECIAAQGHEVLEDEHINSMTE